jgi:hypothetical protein
MKRALPWLIGAAVLAAGGLLWWRFGVPVWLAQAVAWCT